MQGENHLIFNYADFSLPFFFFVLEAKQLGVANTLEINTRATPNALLPGAAIARSCRRDAKMQRDSDDKCAAGRGARGERGNGCDPSDSPSALAWPLEPLGGLAVGLRRKGRGGRGGQLAPVRTKGFQLN